MPGKMNVAGFLMTLTGAVLFSTKAIIVKKAFAETSIDALTLLTVRMIFSLPFFLVAAFVVSNQKGEVRLSSRQWMQVLVLGLFGYYLSSYFDFMGLRYISAGLERLILFLYPTLVLLMNRIFFRQQITGMQLIALLLTYTGIGIAYFDELRFEHANENFFLGTALIFLCSVTYAFYISGSGRVIPAVGANRFTAYAMLAATAGIFVHYITRGDYRVFEVAEGMWQFGLLLAVVATVIPTFLLSAGLMKIGSNNVAIISGIGPVSTIIQAHWILGERVNAGQVAGTLMVIAGVLLIGWRTTSRE